MSSDLPPLSPLLCSVIVYRGLLRRVWLDPDSGQVLPDAFLRRPREMGADADGLSVGIADAIPVEEFAASFKRCFGVASLHVGRVRDLHLDIEPDPEDPKHALIIGLPYREDDPVEAERLAGLLARQSRLAWRVS